MENPKYSQICVDYEELMKRDCNTIGPTNKLHCEHIKKLLENCYQFKEKKSKKAA
jgi:hypothetical protein